MKNNKENALIIGGAGFVGSYLIDQLLESKRWNVHVTKMPNERIERHGIFVHDLNILDIEQTKKVFSDVNPHYVFHLAAQSSVALSWKNPNLTVDINIKGTINVLDALREQLSKPRILLIGSGEEYGNIKDDEVPIKEDNALRPGNIYAITKATQNMIGKLYSDAYGMNIVMVRAFNHIGPKQLETFVVADFCKQVAQIENSQREAILKVGNLNAQRDFTDVRDVVRAYELLVEKAKIGELYNVGSGVSYPIAKLLEMILSFSHVKIKVEVDPSKYRPVDVPIIVADIKKIRDDVDWQPIIPVMKTLEETLDYWRSNVNVINKD